MPRLGWHWIPASLFVDTTAIAPSCPTIRHGLPAASASTRVCAWPAYRRGRVSLENKRGGAPLCFVSKANQKVCGRFWRIVLKKSANKSFGMDRRDRRARALWCSSELQSRRQGSAWRACGGSGRWLRGGTRHGRRSVLAIASGRGARMRFRCANSISIFLRSRRERVGLGLGDVARHVPCAFVD